MIGFANVFVTIVEIQKFHNNIEVIVVLLRTMRVDYVSIVG